MYLVCTIGLAFVLQAKDEKEVQKHKKHLKSLGYKKILVFERSFVMEG